MYWDEEESSAAPEPLTVHAILDILQSSYSRHMVRMLAEKPLDDPVPLTDLAAAVARGEGGGDEIDQYDHKKAWISLYQTYLPKLEKYGVVSTESVDEPGGVNVRPQRRIQRVDAALTCIEAQIDA